MVDANQFIFTFSELEDASVAGWLSED